MRTVIRRYFAFQFFFSLLIWLPVFYEFQRRLGLSDVEIFRIQSIYYVVFALLEIPTGMLGDRIGTRFCLKGGAWTLLIANLLPVIQPNYSGMFLHFMLIALARSLISGASSAYIYDYLKRYDASDQYKQIEGSARAYSLFGKVGCWAVVGSLMEWQLSMPYILTAVSSAIAVVCAYGLPLPQSSAPIGRITDSVGSNLLAIVKLLRSTPILFIIMLQGVALFVMARVLQVNLYQPVLEAKGFAVAGYGMIMSLMTIFEAIGSWRPRMLSRWINDFNAVLILSLIMAAVIACMPMADQLGLIVCLCAFSFISGISFPIQKQLLNDAIPTSQYRATLISLESIIDRSVCAVAAAFIGSFLAAGSLYGYLYLSAGACAVAMVALWAAVRWLRSW